jgi:hypothetical protein
MVFDTFQVVFARDNAVALVDEDGNDRHENVLIHAEAGGKLILVLVSHTGLGDYFALPTVDSEPRPARPTLAQWNLVVDHNIDAFKRIALTMLKSGHILALTNPLRQTFTGIFITEREMHQSGEALTADV